MHIASTIHFDCLAIRCMNAPPSKSPSVYITPCPNARTRANISFFPNCKLLTVNCSLLTLKAVEANATGDVRAMMNSMSIMISKAVELRLLNQYI